MWPIEQLYIELGLRAYSSIKLSSKTYISKKNPFLKKVIPSDKNIFRLLFSIKNKKNDDVASLLHLWLAKKPVLYMKY